jgi:hypothetical protein
VIAIGRRGPDELAALQPLGVERHAQSVMPKHLHEVAPAPTEHKERDSRASAVLTPSREPWRIDAPGAFRN